jgi:two-component system, sensor histidine kinase
MTDTTRLSDTNEALATLRHELRTPLSGIVGLMGILLDTPLSDEQRTMMMTVLAAGTHLGALLDQTLPGMEPDQATTAAVAFDLRTVINDIAGLFRPIAEAKNLKLETVVDPTVPLVVWGDPTRVRQALVNLTSNAVKFTTNGVVRVVVDQERAGASVTFTISDTGPGFRPNDNDELVPRADGTGIGLVISRRVISSLNGVLDVASQHGIGTTCRFTVTLPTATLTDRSMCGSGSRMLIGEDDAVSRQVLMHLARRLGYDVTAVESGSAVLQLHETAEWDVIVLDRRLLDMDGLDVARTIRSREVGGARRTAIIGATATGTDADRERCLAAGMDHYLAKPVSLTALAERLDRCRERALTSTG